MRRQFCIPLLFAAALQVSAQNALQPDLSHRNWHASWIAHPTASLRDPIVLHFRRSLNLASVPAAYTVRVSADNRFILYVNGWRVGDGPARGDLSHWRYERFDIAPYLRSGSNLIAAAVWNFGVYAPIAQMSDRTAFLLESEATGDDGISTPKGWQVAIDPSRSPLGRDTVTFKGYMAAGPGEELDAAKADWDWNSASDSSADWVTPGDPMRESIYPGSNRAHSADETGDNPWGLVQDTLPHMEYTPSVAGAVVRVDGSEDARLRSFPASAANIPANAHIRLLLDRKTLTTAYPQLTVSGGKGARIRLTYAEALYDQSFHKGDRDAVGDRRALGLTDLFLPDGGEHRTFEPLWWRTWRYLDLDITTTNQPLTLESLKANFTAYPFEERAKLDTPDPDLAKISEISWRTARLDAHETYMDTPYWEQLQYIGDTRIQALISYTVANDDRLARQALTAFNDSRIPEGITRSRYPSSLPQNIPTFSLLYIGMLHDYWMYRPDPDGFVRAKLDGVRAILDWYAQYREPTGLLRRTPWWSFVDWVAQNREIPTYDARGVSCVTSLFYQGALDEAADLENAVGDSALGHRDRNTAQNLRAEIARQCWSTSRGLIADTPDRKNFSQQANILAVLYDVIPKASQQTVLRKLLAIEPGTTPGGTLSASYYFRFYLARALDHAGMAGDYLKSLDPWRQLLPLHFSTWPEVPGNTRSDSHAWSAHPIYDLLTLVAGVEPASPGFAAVRIAPHLGNLPSLTAVFPHPAGDIQLQYRRRGSTLEATIALPARLTGKFVYNGKTQPLHPGINHIEAP